MMWIIAQAAAAPPATYEVPQWVGGLGGSALLGVLFYWVLTKQMPLLQTQFHETLKEERQQFREALDKERESRERVSEKTFIEHRDTVKSIIERDEKRQELNVKHHEQLVLLIDSLPNRLRPQV